MIEQILNGEALSSIRTKLNEVINLVNTPVLESLPDVDASKAGRKFWLNGTLWTYAKEGQFGALAVGTPWPVKGYKEYVAMITQSATDNPTATVEKNDLGVTISYVRTFPGSALYTGTYSTSINRIPLLEITSVFRQIGAGETGLNLITANNIADFSFITRSTSGTIVDMAADSGKVYLSIRLYPPSA